MITGSSSFAWAKGLLEAASGQRRGRGLDSHLINSSDSSDTSAQKYVDEEVARPAAPLSTGTGGAAKEADNRLAFEEAHLPPSTHLDRILEHHLGFPKRRSQHVARSTLRVALTRKTKDPSRGRA